MATKTIGTGGDYTSYASYLTYLQTLGTLSAPEIGQQKNEEITIASGINFTGFTPTSTNRWTLETEAGASFRDNANKLTNALRYDPANGAAIKGTANYSQTVVVSVPFATVRNLQILNAAVNGARIITSNNYPGAGNCVFENLVCQSSSTPDFDLVSIDGTADILRNSIVIMPSTRTRVPVGARNGGTVHFCTFVRPSNFTAGGPMLRANYSSATFNNCVWSGFSNTFLSGGGTLSGTNNATDQASFPTGLSGQTSLTATTEFEQPSNASGAMDFRLKSTSVKCKDNGSTDATNGAADIVGTSRPQGSAYDTGCWELAAGGGPTVANPFGLLGVGRAA